MRTLGSAHHGNGSYLLFWQSALPWCHVGGSAPSLHRQTSGEEEVEEGGGGSREQLGLGWRGRERGEAVRTGGGRKNHAAWKRERMREGLYIYNIVFDC